MSGYHRVCGKGDLCSVLVNVNLRPIAVLTPLGSLLVPRTAALTRCSGSLMISPHCRFVVSSPTDSALRPRGAEIFLEMLWGLVYDPLKGSDCPHR